MSSWACSENSANSETKNIHVKMVDPIAAPLQMAALVLHQVSNIDRPNIASDSSVMKFCAVRNSMRVRASGNISQTMVVDVQLLETT